MCAAACVWFCLSYNTSITYSPGAGACGAAQARKVGDDGHLHGNGPWRTTGAHIKAVHVRFMATLLSCCPLSNREAIYYAQLFRRERGV